MFSYISLNWRGKPLIAQEVIVNLIGSTINRKGLPIRAELDTTTLPTGLKAADEKVGEVNLISASFQGEWNHTIAAICSS